MILLVTIFSFVLLAVVGLVYLFFTKRSTRGKLLDKLHLQLFLVRLPHVSSEGKDLAAEIGLFEQLMNSLASLGKPFVFEAAVPHVGEEIHFYTAVPVTAKDTLQRQIHAGWSGAEVEPISDYTIFSPEGETASLWVKLGRKFFLPIRTYHDMDADPFSSIAGGLSQVNETGEGAAVQVIALPTVPGTRSKIQSVIRKLRKGESLKKATQSAFSFEAIADTISPKKKDESQAGIQERALEETALKALEEKVSRPLFRVNVRLVASSPTKEKAEALLQGMSSGFSQFGAPDRNEFKLVSGGKQLLHSFSFREFLGEQEMILNSTECASLFHFPTPFFEIPRVKSLKSKQAPAPTELPRDGVTIGESVYRGDTREVRISDEDRRRHVYLIGQTGTGKSTLITNMAVADIAAGKGVAIVDPHGDLTETVLAQVPESRMGDVIYFNPADLERPLGINMIEYNFDRPEEKTFIVNEMVSIFDKLYDLKATGGPMFEQYMRNALLLLMEDMRNEPATLMEVSRIFTDEEYRRRKLARISNPTVIDFWHKEAEKAGGEAALQNITPYVTSKFNTFTANDYMRVIIGQEQSSFNFRQLMDGGKILLINLSKGRIGDINANLLGMIFVGKILMAALSRVDTQEASRRDFNLYIDEFQNFTTDSIATILSEARKYRLNLVIAHQFIAQLTDTIRDAVFGNVGSVVSFRVGVQDTDILGKEFEPVFDEHDLTNIDNFNAYAKLLIGGQTTRPFNIRTIFPASGNADIASRIREASRMKYGRVREEVEESIYRRLRE